MDQTIKNIADLLYEIAETGRRNASYPMINEIESFAHFFLPDGKLDYANLDRRDGSCTRRELLLRFLAVNAVIDQGPDLFGVRKLLIDVTNSLYRREIRFLHSPIEFFKELDIAIDEILDNHRSIKNIRAELWGQENHANPEKYNLFMDNSKQVLNYAIFRWGVPLALPLLLTYDCEDDDKEQTALIDFLESWGSAEIMSQMLKDHERYGLGKAIGDKACHLFAKWMVTGFKLSRKTDSYWDDFSFEVPFDSNAGRVLWRTGYFLKLISEDELIKRSVIHPGQGKGGQNYIRVTNIRGIKTDIELPDELWERYIQISCNHLRTHRRQPQKAEVQRIQHAFLLDKFEGSSLSIADFDEGLMNIGTKYCFNHSTPLCETCPINIFCDGHNQNKSLIENYRT